MCEPPLAFLMSKLRANLEELNNREKAHFMCKIEGKCHFTKYTCTSCVQK